MTVDIDEAEALDAYSSAVTRVAEELSLLRGTDTKTLLIHPAERT